MASFADFFGNQTEAEAAFIKTPFDANRARNDRKARNAKAAETVKAGGVLRGKSEVKVQNGLARFEPKLPGGRAFLIEGRAVSYIAADRFSDFVKLLDSEIDKGTFDAALDPSEAPDAGETAAKPSAPAPAKGDKPKGGEGGEGAEAPKRRGRPKKVAEPA